MGVESLSTNQPFRTTPNPAAAASTFVLEADSSLESDVNLTDPKVGDNCRDR